MDKKEAIKVHKAMRLLGIMKAIYVHRNNDQYRYTYLDKFKFKLNSIIPEPHQETVFEYNLPHGNRERRNIEIIKKWMAGAKQVDLAREYNLSTTTIGQKINQFRIRAPRSDKWNAYYLQFGLNYGEIKER